jgi:hypothetical protein
VARACWPDSVGEFCGACFGQRPGASPCVTCAGRGDGFGVRVVALLDSPPVSAESSLGARVRSALVGLHFDVSLVRAYCERLVAEGERLAMERVVFVDWTRAQGKGPENRERGAFVQFSPGVEATLVREWRSVFKNGGWPGPLAREYGWERCKACGGSGSEVDPPSFVHPCSTCKGRGRTRKPGIPPGFANGDSIARTAKRLLDTLDGRCPWAPSASAQVSRHAVCNGFGMAPMEVDGVSGVSRICFDCRGTGHNLSGVLPAVEHPRPRVSDRQARAGIAVASLAASARFEFARAALLGALANTPSLSIADARQRLVSDGRLMTFSAAEVAGG